MANGYAQLAAAGLALGWISTANSQLTTALNSAYVFGSTGNSLGVRFQAPTSSTLTHAYFYVTAKTGTPNPAGLTCELRNFGSTTVPGSTVHASQAGVPTGAGTWVRFAFASPFAVTRGTWYYVVVADVNGGALNLWTVAHVGACTGDSYSGINTMFNAHTTANGWSTGTNVGNSVCCCVLKFGDGTLMGSPYTSTANSSSGVLERGLKIKGLTDNIIVSGVMANAMTSVNAFKIYDAATAPGGTPLLSVTPDANSPGLVMIRFAPFTLRVGQEYRAVFGFSGASTAPSLMIVDDPSTYSDILAASFNGGNIHACIDNNAGAWTDQTDRILRMSLLIDDNEYLTIRG